MDEDGDENSFVKYELTNEMNEFFQQNLSHLNAQHIDYAKKWMKWIFAEWRAAKARGIDARLFREAPMERYVFFFLIYCINQF